MGERKTYKELEAIKKKYNCSTLWSFSKYNTYKNDTWEYMLKYVKKVKPDIDRNIYMPLGTLAHDIMEKYYNKEIKYEDMLGLYEDGWLKLQLAGYKFNQSDETKNESTMNKYKECMEHFFKFNKPIEGKVEIERFVLIKIDFLLLQGYVDILFKDGENFIVGDFKTSTLYTGDKLKKEAFQLCIYSEALIQAGIPLKNIKPRWNFLKYIKVETQLAKIDKETKLNVINTRYIERNQIGSKLSSNVKMWLGKSEYTEDEIENYLSTMILTNSIEHLPEEVKSKYKFSDAWVEIPLTQEIIDDVKNDVKETLVDIMKKQMEWEETKDDSIWWQDVSDNQASLLAMMGSFSPKLHLPWKKYLEDRKEKDGGYINDNKEDENDLSWLNEIM
jgi:hypothetical protein